MAYGIAGGMMLPRTTKEEEEKKRRPSEMILPRTEAAVRGLPIESKPLPREEIGAMRHPAHGAIARPIERPEGATEIAPIGEQPIPAQPGGVPGYAGAAPEALYAPGLDEGAAVGGAVPAGAERADIPEAPEVDKGRALRRGALVAGLTMLERGGRAYATPVDASSIIGTGGLAGVGAYERDIAQQRGEFKEEQELRAGGIKLAGAEQELAEAPLRTERLQLENKKISAAIESFKGDQEIKNILNEARKDFAQATTKEQRDAISKFITGIAGDDPSKRKKTFKGEIIYEQELAPDGFTYIKVPTGVYDFNTKTLLPFPGREKGAGASQFQEGKSYRDRTTGKTFKYVNGEKVFY